jgi:F-type H+-transporting ATPase subunit epsilon
MQLEIVTPDRKVIVGQTNDIVIPAKDGEIDVLPGHAPYLGQLGTGILRFTSAELGNKEVRLMVSGGFVEVDNDRVVLMCESASLQEEVRAEDERKQLHGLEQKLAALGAASEDDESFQQLRAEVDRAASRLTLVR